MSNSRGLVAVAKRAEALAAGCFQPVSCARVVRSTGLLVEAEGLNAEIGRICWLRRGTEKIACEVVGFHDSRCYLMPLAPTEGINPGTLIEIPHGKRFFGTLPGPDALMGRIVDGLCRPMDDNGPLHGERIAVRQTKINPLSRPPIGEALDVGVAAINALLQVGVGQRVGLFAGSGVGKSVLLGMLARFARADVVVVGLIGERGREVREFIVDNLGAGLARSIVVACPADDSPALRLRGAQLATQIAEVLRDEGKRVLLLMDSLTRVAQAQREIGLAMGEPPTTKGYTPSAFAWLPRLVERAGCADSRPDASGGKAGGSAAGSITAFYTVLMEEDDLQDPIVDAARAVLDGHIVLSRKLAEEGLYPAIDVSNSVSRLMQKLAGPEQLAQARQFRALWQRYADQEDLINIGAYQTGSDELTDRAIVLRPQLREFLAQSENEPCSMADSLAGLGQALTLTNGQSAGDGQALLDHG